jgi:hypothetical protein
MNLVQWEHWLAQGGEASYRALFPELCTQIVRGIVSGVPIDFTGDRNVNRFGHNLPIEPEHIDKVSAVIAKDVAELKKAGPFDRAPFPFMAVSPIGAVPKKNSAKVRVIHHLSYPVHGDSVNAGVADESLRISSFGHAARAVRQLGKGCFLIKLDVEAAYKQVPVQREDWPLLGFKWLGKWYYERVLPFGLKSSCRLWELYAAALHHFFAVLLPCDAARAVIHYVDDFLFVVALEEPAVHFRDRALGLCKMLGIPMAADKTEGPVTKLTFLGIELDTVAMRASLPADKLIELQRLVHDWGRRDHASIKELQSLTGMLNFACSVVRPGRFYLRRIIDHTTHLLSSVRTATFGFRLPDEVQADIDWWRAFLPEWNGVSLLYELEWTDAPLIELYTDACLTGYGGRFGDRWFAGAWSPEVLAIAQRATRVSMPFLELMALALAVATWGHLWSTRKITFRSDCMPVVDAIRKRSSRKPATMHLLRFISDAACRHGFDFRCIHIPGIANVAADLLSRDGAAAFQLEEMRAAFPTAKAEPSDIGPVPLPSPRRPIDSSARRS